MSSLNFDESDIGLVLAAVRFSAEKHRDDRRKGEEETPYINHPIEVAETLWRVGRVRDIDVIVAAILHDTIEDTDATPDEIESRFGPAVSELVQEVSDDTKLPNEERKRLQIETAPHKSTGAKQIKLADKISNVQAITDFPPANWKPERKRAYLDWAGQVVNGLRGVNAPLEKYFDEVLQVARERLAT
jgi:guanosine-3',5'-bis(diphosphate) 3'-pyrophosphohydrolase